MNPPKPHPLYLQSASEAMGRELDASWVALVDETIRRKVAAGDADQEILDAMARAPFFDVPPGIRPAPILPKWQHIETHLALLRLHAAEVTMPDEPKRRGRSVSDLPGAYDDAIRVIRRGHGKLTWKAVAVEISHALNISPSLDPGTLRGWCKADGLPHPGERERLMRA